MGAHSETSRILIIDDDAPMSRMMAMALRSNGHCVAIAHDGQSGLEQVESQQPHLIVLDLRMPVMDGRTFYRRLRELGIDTPVVIVSAHDARRAQRELDAQGALNKPVFPEHLAAKVEELLVTLPGESR